MNTRTIAPIPTPLGRFLAVVDRDGALVALDFDARTSPWRELPPDERRAKPVIEALTRYFTGECREFHLSLAPEGTPFQKRVWAELARIPYGATISYGELARRLGDERAVRAVGRANGANPIPIVVPCHRVIGADGTLTGYAGGLERKQALLTLEARHSGHPVQLALTGEERR
ncbi:MAG: methylated-DNA--[protein]-cysteine S-methyltransferase [Planctomycetes bacterium]|nr:methylated-DNA--[protein]-cysteine S-methyltransferase [Planctomycetota bacterium]